MFFKALCHISTVLSVHLLVCLSLCLHRKYSLIGYALYCSAVVKAPLPAVIIQPALVYIAIADLPAEQIYKAFCVPCIIKSVQLYRLVLRSVELCVYGRAFTCELCRKLR